MDRIRNITLLVVLLVAGTSLAADDPGPTPLDYWLTDRGVVIHMNTRQTGVDGVSRDMTIRSWNGGGTSFDGRLVFRQLKIYSDVGPEGEVPHPVMTIFQVVDDTVSQTMAVQYYGEEIEREHEPFIDLKGPLVEGTTWSYETMIVPWSFGIEEEVTLAIDSEIVETGITLETPAGTFEDCIRVVDDGRSIGNVRLWDEVHQGQAVSITWQIERVWAPGLGSIRERNSQRMSTVRRPVQVLNEWLFEMDIERVDGR